MPGRKQEHLAESIQHKLGLLLKRSTGDPRLEGVTVTSVHLSKDRAHAQVGFSVYSGSPAALAGPAPAGRHPPADHSPLAVEAALNHAAGYLAHALAQSLQARRTPHLHFVYDPGFDYAQHMEELLQPLRPPEPAAPANLTSPAELTAPAEPGTPSESGASAEPAPSLED
ncbi:MAG TPA: ribosome-binding factor A [bacterium]|nr:ribosome-binding factor A [bacterium]